MGSFLIGFCIVFVISAVVILALELSREDE